MPSFYSPIDFERAVKVKNFSYENYRTPFSRDLSRLIHSPAFRRLSGKTQIFPGEESDFFRNRLTHSIEVADVAKSIANKINRTHGAIKHWNADDNINLDLIVFACLAHDIGHPPFGHVGERALDECMIDYGRFEGNAQTLRILTKLEKKQTTIDTLEDFVNYGIVKENGNDTRCGLNLTHRSLLSILKYDELLQAPRDAYKGVSKGYYRNELSKIQFLKELYSRKWDIQFSESVEFKTIECSIMDLADDITYTVYDLEDTLQARFIDVIDFFDLEGKREIYINILQDIKKKINKFQKLKIKNQQLFSSRILNYAKFFGEGGEESQINMLRIRFFQIFNEFIPFISNKNNYRYDLKLRDRSEQQELVTQIGSILHTQLRNLTFNGYWRRKLSTNLVKYFIKNIQFFYNDSAPLFSKAYLKPEALVDLEILKKFISYTQVRSNRIQIVEYRGKEIIKKIFSTLIDKSHEGFELLPPDYKQIYMTVKDEDRPRIICDFIAGMTNKYAVEFYGRLTSENPQTIFKPY